MKHTEWAKEVAKTMANGLFKAFSEEKSQGPRFTWEGFPNLAANFAETQCFMNFSHWDRFSKRKKTTLEKIAGVEALEEARRLIKTEPLRRRHDQRTQDSSSTRWS